ncbi:hypothetical protein [Microbacterium sp. KNMS]
MTAAVDEDTRILEGLDFDVPCSSAKGGSHPADFVASCRMCGTTLGFICRTHLDANREYYTFPRGVKCRTCLTARDEFDDLVSVTPLGGRS